MTAPFECEVRFLVSDRDAFEWRLAERGGRIRFRYAFADHYYRPSEGAWDPRTRAVRIRELAQPTPSCEVLLTRTDLMQVDGLTFKRSRFPEGKVRLFAGTLEACRAVVEALGYEPWLVVRKTVGLFFEVPDLGDLVIEEVEGIGWMGEVEVAGEDPHAAAAAIRRKLDLLGVPPQAVLPDPLAAFVAARSRRGRTVYFCGAIRGGRALQPVYAKIVASLHDRGWEVLTRHVASPDVLAAEERAGFAASDIYARDMRWLQDCDLVVAEVSLPSLGVGIELATAQHIGKPIICLCHTEVALSALVDGNPGLRVLRYKDAGEALSMLEGALPDLNPHPPSEALHQAGPTAG
jgi:adenylate cyclase class IV